MTQDPQDQAQDMGYAVPGQVVPDDDPDAAAEEDVPMTRFQKVASAFRGDRTGQAATDDTVVDADVSAGPAGPADEEDAARTEDIDAVRGGPDGARDDWDEQDPDREQFIATTTPAGAVAQDPVMLQPDMAVAAEPGVTGKHAAAPALEPLPEAEPGLARAGTAAETELRPGEADGTMGDVTGLAFGTLLPDASEFKARWQEVQFRFVDDPKGSVTEAADVLAQVAAQLEAAIAERQRAIAERQASLRRRWSEGEGGDTETMRATLLMYRAFLDQLTGSRTS